MIDNILKLLLREADLQCYLNKSSTINIHKIYQRQQSTTVLIEIVNKKDISRLYAKIQPEIEDNKIKSEYNILYSIYNHYKNDHLYSTPKPFAYFPKLKTFITFAWLGRPLSETIANHCKVLRNDVTDELVNSIKHTTKWLKDFHNNVKLDIPDAKNNITQYINVRLKILEDNGLIKKSLADKLRNRIHEIEKASFILPNSNYLLHNDFAPYNILFNNGRICVLDFFRVGYGHYLFDVVGFWLSLKRHAEMPHYSAKKMLTLQNVFLNSYGIHKKSTIEFKLFELLHRVIYMCGLCKAIPLSMSPYRSLLRSYEVNKYRKFLQQFIIDTE